MKTSAKNLISGAPTPMAGLALAIGSLGWSWENAANFHGYAQWSSALVAAILLIVLYFKFIYHHHLLLNDLAHPVVGSVVPTFTMGTMVVSSSIGHFYPLIGDGIWLFAVLLHVVFLCVFTYHRCKEFEVHHMVPSWFVPPIGIVVGDVSFSGNPALAPLAHAILIFGLISYAIMLPVMIYRFIFAEHVPDTSKPTLAIMAAPASLCLAGYLTFSTQPSPLVIMILLPIALLMTALIYICFIKLLALPFSPAYAAFTFPMVIGATALFKTAKWMANVDLFSSYAHVFYQLAVVELLVATCVVGYVAYRYWAFYRPHQHLFQHDDMASPHLHS